jgi:hypothetical protein
MGDEATIRNIWGKYVAVEPIEILLEISQDLRQQCHRPLEVLAPRQSRLG